MCLIRPASNSTFAKRQNRVQETRSCLNWSCYQPSHSPTSTSFRSMRPSAGFKPSKLRSTWAISPAPRSSERRGEEKQGGKPGFNLGTRNVEQRNREGAMSWEGKGDTVSYFTLMQTLMTRTPPCKKHIQLCTFQYILSSETGDSVRSR